MRTAVIGSGAWGTALALALLNNGHETALWSYTGQESAVLRNKRENPMLPGIALPESLELTTELACVKGRGAVVLATEGELHQILYNLAENAIKYNRPGGRVRVTAEPGEESTILTVEDNGIGIPAEDLSNVFKRFYRVDKARSRAAGTGLGLSIVSDTVSRRGGAIRAENVEGGGTRFIVTLPSMERGEEEL